MLLMRGWSRLIDRWELSTVSNRQIPHSKVDGIELEQK